MKRKILFVTILMVFISPVNPIHAAENEEPLENTLTSEAIEGTKEGHLSDEESLFYKKNEEDLEDTIDVEIANEEIDSTELIKLSDSEVVANGQNGTGFTWTLYKDGLLTLGGGTWLGGFPPWYTRRHEITVAVITDRIEILPDNKDGFGLMFYDCRNLLSIGGLELLDTANSKSFGRMFYRCENLKNVDVSSFDTSNSTSFLEMFYECLNLETIDVSGFNTSNAITFEGMFAGCAQLTSLDVSNFKTENTVSFARMFSGCAQLTSLDVSNFKTENTVSFARMFAGCRNLTELDISKFKTKKATNLSGMFQNMVGITELNVSHFDTQNVTNMEYMFYGMSNLISLNTEGFDVTNVQQFNACFSDLTSIESLDLSHFVTSSIREADYVFRNMSNLRELNIDNWIIPSGLLAYKFFGNTVPEKITVGPEFVMNTHMDVPSLSTGYVWADKNDEVIFSPQLIDFHNKNGISNTYRIEKLYTLLLDTNGGSAVSNQKSIAGKTWSVPEMPEKNGFIFEYWSTDPEGKNPYDFTTPVLGSLTLYAQYTVAYVVTIPASMDLNETNQMQISAENYQDEKYLVVSAAEKVTVTNIHDTTRTIEKAITKEKEFSESTHVLEIRGPGEVENTLVIQEPAEKEPAGTYKGILNFIVEFY
ncbi:BspA family leucine-rich repeat surface protein [Enterococcus sp. AZ109]|uniref:BspA family leucine-rich repeat surface protein n=1 Tax=Enterococcus sp. AZ109 TaxID=2774634 RepID=UPI003F298F8C